MLVHEPPITVSNVHAAMCSQLFCLHVLETSNGSVDSQATIPYNSQELGDVDSQATLPYQHGGGSQDTLPPSQPEPDIVVPSSASNPHSVQPMSNPASPVFGSKKVPVVNHVTKPGMASCSPSSAPTPGPWISKETGGQKQTVTNGKPAGESKYGLLFVVTLSILMYVCAVNPCFI